MAKAPRAGSKKSIRDDSTLRGPDVSDDPPEVVEEVGDPIDYRARTIVYRWVFLPHQRPAALRELRELIADVRKERANGEGPAVS